MLIEFQNSFTVKSAVNLKYIKLTIVYDARSRGKIVSFRVHVGLYQSWQ